MALFEAGRRHAHRLEARSQLLSAQTEPLWELTPQSGQEVILSSPNVGEVRLLVGVGDVLMPGSVFGTLNQLGAVSQLRVPKGVQGQVRACATSQQGQAQIYAAFQSPLLVVDPAMNQDLAQGTGQAAASAHAGGQSFVSPSSGRFYRRPSPDKAAFLEEGQIIEQGQTIGMLEIMKTFTRIPFSGDDLPQKVKVTQIVAQDEDELSSGDVIFHFEPA